MKKILFVLYSVIVLCLGVLLGMQISDSEDASVEM